MGRLILIGRLLLDRPIRVLDQLIISADGWPSSSSYWPIKLLHWPIKQQSADQVVIGRSVSDRPTIGFSRLSAIIDWPITKKSRSVDHYHTERGLPKNPCKPQTSLKVNLESCITGYGFLCILNPHSPIVTLR